MNGRLTRLTMKPGVSAQRTVTLPQAIISRGRASSDGRIGGRRDDHLDERHDRGRVEEMEPEHARRLGGRAGDRLDREGARVGREDGLGPRRRIERAQDRALGGQVLERGLDDEARVGLGQDVQRGGGAQA